jgi:hypothetical protein
VVVLSSSVSKFLVALEGVFLIIFIEGFNILLVFFIDLLVCNKMPTIVGAEDGCFDSSFNECEYGLSIRLTFFTCLVRIAITGNSKLETRKIVLALCPHPYRHLQGKSHRNFEVQPTDVS